MTRDSIDDVPALSESSGLCGGDGQMTCDEANQLIQMVIDELIDIDERTRLEEHLGDCSPCESEFFVYQRIVTSLSKARPNIPTDTASRLAHYCDEMRKQGPPPLGGAAH